MGDPSQASSSSLPSVHLPVVQSQGSADDSQRGRTSAPATAPGSPLDDPDEKDLFGSSDSDDAPPPAASRASGSATGSAAGSAAGTPRSGQRSGAATPRGAATGTPRSGTVAGSAAGTPRSGSAPSAAGAQRSAAGTPRSAAGTPRSGQHLPATPRTGIPGTPRSGAAVPRSGTATPRGSAPGSGVATPRGSAPGTPVGSAPIASGEFEDDLDVDERDLFGTDDEAEPAADEPNERDLFGSEDEGDEVRAEQAPESAEAGKPQPPSRAMSEATVEPSEMDEEDIFGRDLSDDELDDKKQLEEVVLRRRPMPSAGRNFAALKIPNILAIEKKPFNPLKFSEDVRNGFKEKYSTQAKQSFQLLNPENVIRWRFKKNEEGHILTMDDGRPQYESNSRIVEWEDGSRTLYVGSEAFMLNSMPDHVMLFEENTAEASVCHGFIQNRLVATPRSLDSSTHENTRRAQFNKFMPNSRSLLINTDDQAYLQQQQALEREHEKEKEKRARKMLKAGTTDTRMNAAFLESDDDAPLESSPKRPKL